MNRRYGKLPATRPLIKLSSYLAPGVLPTPPADFGWDHLIADDAWGMFANDQYGDCVWAGAAHEHMLWAKSGKTSVEFSQDSVLAAYSAVTGFDPDNPATDQGTNVQAAALYRQRVGLTDTAGNQHKIGAFAALQFHEIAPCAWKFGSVGIGIQVPESAEIQFEGGKPWDVTHGYKIIGGHYVPIVGRANGFWHVVTWGRVQLMTDRFLAKYCDEAYVYLSTDELCDGVNLVGANLAELQTDMRIAAAA